MSRPFLIIILIVIAAAVAVALTYQGERTIEPTVEEQQQDPVKEAVEAQDSMPDDSSQGASGDTTVQGIIESVNVGGEIRPAVVLKSEDGNVSIRGPLLDEISNLTGVEVRLWGTRGTPVRSGFPTSWAIEVSEYEAISLFGKKPYVGILTETDGTLRLNDLILAGVPELRSLVGAKVLITGRVVGDTLFVTGHRVIRRP